MKERGSPVDCFSPRLKMKERGSPVDCFSPRPEIEKRGKGRILFQPSPENERARKPMAMQKRGLPIVKPYISPLTVFQTVRFQSSV